MISTSFKDMGDTLKILILYFHNILSYKKLDVDLLM
jgi:hypothetical protein